MSLVGALTYYWMPPIGLSPVGYDYFGFSARIGCHECIGFAGLQVWRLEGLPVIFQGCKPCAVVAHGEAVEAGGSHPKADERGVQCCVTFQPQPSTYILKADTTASVSLSLAVFCVALLPTCVGAENTAERAPVSCRIWAASWVTSSFSWLKS